MLTCYFEDGNKASLRHAVVDTLVLRGNEILLVKRAAQLVAGGKWCLPGGFADLNETMVQAAEREVFEETGWKVSSLKLFTIIDKPNRSKEDRQNVAFVYFCQAVQQTGKPDWESDEIHWFSLSDLSDKNSIAFDHPQIIDLYKKYLEENLTLPILG